MTSSTPLYFLSGPTASGKTTVAHLLADRMGLRLLSVDSMMVYRGMEIGTAKPTPEEQKRYDYAGVNLADPGEAFSAGTWVEQVAGQLDERPTLAVGGTGLYFKALMLGLEPGTGADRREERPVADLQRELEALRPGVLSRLPDPENPRRLERALQWIQQGKDLPDQWGRDRGEPLPVLIWETDTLNRRIEQRVREMFHQGLLQEVQTLRDRGVLTGTAAQAIGYCEAVNVLDGTCTEEQAVQTIATRTRRYAKRQRTWFRNQMESRPVQVDEQNPVEETARQVARIWEETGPFLYSGS